MQARTEVGDARVAEEDEIDVVVFGEFVEKKIEILADPGERLVERTDVDADP